MTTLPQIIGELDKIRLDERDTVRQANSTVALEDVRRSIFGKKGRLSILLRAMGGLSAVDRPQAGKAANEIKEELQVAIDERARELQAREMEQSVEAEHLDISLPGIRPRLGTLHPLTRILREIEDAFISMGFTVELGPDIEDDFHNFGALNFPPDHPARDTQDTFYLASDLLLRTHTSPVQIRTMQSRKPPLAVIAPGKCYRCDTPDATHSPTFHQIEGFMVDTHIRFSDLKGCLETFVHSVFGPNIPYRLRPHFFPFTEPSAEMDIYFERLHPDGHVVRQWLEILGAGMIHPNVLQNCGIDPEVYTGFAFGMGIERIAMLKYGINNIGLYFENDVRFLSQFK